MGLYIEMSASDPEIYWIHRRLICLFSPRPFNCDQYPLRGSRGNANVHSLSVTLSNHPTSGNRITIALTVVNFPRN
jgi:hypothetical protein